MCINGSMHASNVYYGTGLTTLLPPGELLQPDALPASEQWHLLKGCKFYKRHSLLFLKSYQCAFALSSHANANPLIYSTFYCVPFVLTYLGHELTRFLAIPLIVFHSVHRYTNTDELCATLIHNCHCPFVQVPFRVQGCAILQTREYLIETVILNLHALTIMWCDQKFTDYVAPRAIFLYRHNMVLYFSIQLCVKRLQVFFNFTLCI